MIGHSTMTAEIIKTAKTVNPTILLVFDIFMGPPYVRAAYRPFHFIRSSIVSPKALMKSPASRVMREAFAVTLRAFLLFPRALCIID